MGVCVCVGGLSHFLKGRQIMSKLGDLTVLSEPTRK